MLKSAKRGSPELYILPLYKGGIVFSEQLVTTPQN
jgi:hypothetical protein